MKVQIITVKSWNIRNALKFQQSHPEHETIISEKLNEDTIFQFNPDYIFFPHWSENIPAKIYEKYNCILFHITDLPFGRGGSPLQNLISRKIYKTKISAIRVNGGFDEGDIYCQKDIDISEGNADDILKKASDIIFSKMIPYIINNNPIPKPQESEAIYFKRRTQIQSNLSVVNFNDAYDFIRMLDGEGYPAAFIDTENLHITFKKVQKENGKIKGEFQIHDR